MQESELAIVNNRCFKADVDIDSELEAFLTKRQAIEEAAEPRDIPAVHVLSPSPRHWLSLPRICRSYPAPVGS